MLRAIADRVLDFLFRSDSYVVGSVSNTWLREYWRG